MKGALRPLRWRFIGALFAVVHFGGPAFAAEKVKVVASFSILGDFVKNIGGDRVNVTDLVGPNGDPHVFEPSPADASLIADAKIVFINGLGLEGWITRLISASNKQVPVVVTTRTIATRASQTDQSRIDPHAWQSVTNAEIYAANIRDALIAADPASTAAYKSNYSAYLAKLTALDQEIRTDISTIPSDHRRVLTNHDAFGYFADSYGIVFKGLQGLSTNAEPSAKDVALAIRQIKEQKITALFLENITNPVQLKSIAEETGVKIGGTLYSDALTEATGPAPTYIDLIRHNVQTLAAALK